MAENYVVNYDINVRAQQGLESIRKFQEATLKLDECGRKLMTFQKKVESVSAKFSQMAKKAPVFDIATSKASKKLDAVIVKLEKIHRLAKKTAVLNVSAIGTSGNSGKGGSNTLPPPPIISPGGNKPSKTNIIPKNIGYRTLGPTMIDSGGVGAFNIIKGMGVAYGITGLGAMMGKVLREATEYDNIMKTTQNILKTHDKRPEFDRRFKDMEQIVRNVGVETKFTAPQVAGASKFLAMAGFDLDAINKSIRPISDIALVGDTDLGETADVVTNIMTGYGIKPEKMQNAADIMTMTFTKTNTTLMDIAEAYKYSASLLSAGGISFEEATAGLGLLGDAGIKGSQAGTTMRTIMANIVNPTKKQLGQWERIGTQRFDEHGNVRPLIDIFQDLNKAGLKLDDFYKIFHKTAAQGAVSLTNHVDKWNEVIFDNFLSEGLAHRLAEEKKKTIQGLWFQLTSAFTENGMQAFEELQKPIKDMLNQTISWMGTPEAVQMVKDISRSLMELVSMLKDVATGCIKAYQAFKPLVDFWIWFQVKSMPYLIAFRSIKALATSFGYLINLSGKIVLFTSTIMKLSKALFTLKLAGSLRSMSLGFGNFFAGKYLLGSRNISPEVWERYQRMNPNSHITGIGSNIKMIGGSLAGGVLGATIGDKLGGDAGGFLGGIAGSLLGGIGGTALASLFSNPVGWAILAAAAIGGVSYYFKQYHDKIEECTKANQTFLSSTQAINGVNMSEHATMADKYLSIVYNKQLDTNQAIGEHLNLMREQLGLMKQAEQEFKEKVPFKDSNKKVYEDASAAFGRFATDNEMYKAATLPVYDAAGKLDIGMHVSTIKSLNQHGKEHSSLQFNGINFGYSDDKYIYDNIAAARTLYGLGRNTSSDTQARSLIDNYHQRILLSESTKDFYAVIKDLVSYAQKMSYIPGSETWSMSQIGKNSLEENQKGYHYVSALKSTLYDQFRWNDPNTAEANLLATLQKMLTSFEQNKPISNDLLEKYLLQSGVDIFNESRYGKFGSDGFMKHFGWYNDKWNAGEYSFLNRDTNKIETVNVTADEARRAFLTFHQQIIDVVGQLSPKLRSYFHSYTNSSIWNLDSVEAPKEGDQKWIDGKLSEYKLNGPTGKHEWVPLANQPNLNPDGSATGADQSKYKSHYQSGSAAPKQIIVKIENLMNVKSIDLTNPDNVAVIENVRGQLTQALIDVVHDFDDTFHG